MSTSFLSPSDLAAAGNALVQWFNSQEISSRDAEAIMSKVTASSIARRTITASPQGITEELSLHSLTLVKDLADAIYALRGARK